MAPLPGSPPPNAPGTGSPTAPSPASIPNPAQQHPMGARTPTGLPYGQAQALQNAQHQMPIAPQGQGGAPAPGGTGGNLPIDHPQVLQAAQGFNPPPMPLDAKSDRPNEPVTTGIPTGPGGGPEVLQPPRPPDPLVTGLAQLNALGNNVTQETKILRAAIEATLGNRMAQ